MTLDYGPTLAGPPLSLIALTASTPSSFMRVRFLFLFSLHLLLLLVDERELLLFDGALRPSCFYSAQKWFNFAYNSFFDSYSDASSFIPWFVFVNFKVVTFHFSSSSNVLPYHLLPCPKLARNVGNTPLTIFPQLNKVVPKFRTSAEPTLYVDYQLLPSRLPQKRWIA